MVDIPMRMGDAITRDTVMNINTQKVLGAVTAQNVDSINHAYEHQSVSPAAPSQSYAAPPQPQFQQPQFQQPYGQATAPYVPPVQQPVAPVSAQNQQFVSSVQQPYGQATAPYVPPVQQPVAPVIVDRPVPPLQNLVQKGQKFALESSGKLSRVKACLGWNIKNAASELDVSAFLLGANGKVLGDDWFVFYGQTTSPDGSCVFSTSNGEDREIISIDITRLNPAISKIVFVLTINEALEKKLNFSMIKDAYVRVFDTVTGQNIVSFILDEYYPNVTSMMIGELYLHNGAWKFNAVGSGVARDLAGLCELYGVQVV